MCKKMLRRRKRGAMLIDAMIGIYILAIVGLIYAATLSAAAISRAMADEHTKAVALVSRQLESIKNVGYANLTYDSLYYYKLIDASPNASPYSITNTGLQPSDRVCNILKSGTGTVKIDDVTASLRKVTVKVSWVSRGSTRSVSASTQLASLK